MPLILFLFHCLFYCRCCVAKKIFGDDAVPKELVIPKQDPRCNADNKDTGSKDNNDKKEPDNGKNKKKRKKNGEKKKEESAEERDDYDEEEEDMKTDETTAVTTTTTMSSSSTRLTGPPCVRATVVVASPARGRHHRRQPIKIHHGQPISRGLPGRRHHPHPLPEIRITTTGWCSVLASVSPM